MSDEPRHIHNALGEILKYPLDRLPFAICHRPADVIAIEHKTYWQFAIVTEVEGNIIVVIEDHSNDDIDGFLGGVKCFSPAARSGVTYNRIDFNSTKVWRVCIPLSECLRDEDVVQRAKSRLGEEGHASIFSPELFAFWCKTGEASSSQLDTAIKFTGQQVTRIAAKGIAGVVAKKAIEKAAKETAKPIVKKVIKKTGQQAAEPIIKELVSSGTKSTAKSTARQIATTMVAADVAVGVGFAVWDIANANEKYESGEITEDEFKSAVGTRAAAAVGDMALGSFGVMVGTAVGGPIGGVIGGTLGSIYGNVIGAATANVIKSNNNA